MYLYHVFTTGDFHLQKNSLTVPFLVYAVHKSYLN